MMGDLYVYKNQFWKTQWTFDYTGGSEVFSLPPGEYLFICNGAKGGTCSSGSANNPAILGGTTYGIMNLNKNKTFYACVGGDGSDGDVGVQGQGGWNGGGNGGLASRQQYSDGPGGGGATDVRMIDSTTEYVDYTLPEEYDEYEYIESVPNHQDIIDTGYVINPETKLECKMFAYNNGIPSEDIISNERFVGNENMWVQKAWSSNTSYINWKQCLSAFQTQNIRIPITTPTITINLKGSRSGYALWGLLTFFTSQSVVGFSSQSKIVKETWNVDDRTVTVPSGVTHYGIIVELNPYDRETFSDGSRPYDITHNDVVYVKTEYGAYIKPNMPKGVDMMVYGSGYNRNAYTTYCHYLQTRNTSNVNTAVLAKNNNQVSGTGFIYDAPTTIVQQGQISKFYDESGNLVNTISNQSTSNSSCQTTLTLFGCNVSTGLIPDNYSTNPSRFFVGRIYNFKIYEKDKLLHYFVPAKRKSAHPFTMNLTENDIEQGDSNYSDGDYYTQYRCRTKEFYLADEFRGAIYVEAYDKDGNPLKWNAITYKNNSTEPYNHVFDIGWLNSGSTGVIYYNLYGVYIRFAFRHNETVEETPLSPEDIGTVNITVTSSNPGLYDLITQRFYANRSRYAFLTGDLIPDEDRSSYREIVINEESLNSRIIVAGGGGGSSYYNYSGNHLPAHFGVGGGILGGAVGGVSNDENYDACAGQNNGYSFGTGMTPPVKEFFYTNNNEGSGGGGGGWFGGYTTKQALENNTTAGGGGSGYVLTSSSYKPEGYILDPDVVFTDPCMRSGTSERASIIICKKVYTFGDGDTLIFTDTGQIEEFKLPRGEYTLKCWGGDGGTRYAVTNSAHGGYAEGTINLTDVTKTFVRVAGSALRYAYDYNKAIQINPSLTFNGGGTSGDVTDFRATFGGGASDIRLLTDSLYNRVIVAGGGGGHGSAEAASNRFGGAGGGESGNASVYADHSTVPGPGTQTGTPTDAQVGGGFGFGGSGYIRYGGFGGAGGSGWFGGSGCIPDGSNDDDRGGCGGSGYVLTDVSYKPGGYALGSDYYLTDTYLAANDQTHTVGSAKVEIYVVSVKYVMYLCEDAEGLKYYDTTNETWTYLASRKPTQNDFEHYGSLEFKSDNGLLNDFTVYLYNPGDIYFDNATFTVVPIEQTVTVTQYTEDLLSKMIIDADVDEETTQLQVIANRSGVGEGAHIEFQIKVKFNDVPAYDVKMYSIIGQTKSKLIHHEHKEKIKTLDHIDLLPTKTFSTVPSNYRTHIGGYIDDGQTAITSIQSSVTCEHNRMIYSATLCNDTIVRFTKLNLLTNQISVVKDVPKSSLKNKYYGGLLADDDYFYLAAADINSSKSIWKIPIDPSDNRIIEIGPDASSISPITAYGKMDWYDDHTIIMTMKSGLLLFDTVNLKWSMIYNSGMSTNRYDTAIGKRFAFLIYDGTSTSGMIYDFKNKNWFDSNRFLEWGNKRCCCCYKDGKFYITQANYIYILDEDKMSALIDDGTTFTYRAIVAAYQSLTPRTINCDNGALYITIFNSPTLYVYDIARDEFITTALPFSMRSTDYLTNVYRPFTFKGFFFVGNFKLYVANFTDYAKYNVGYKYNQFVIPTNNETEERFTYDDRFVTFHDEYMNIHIGEISYPITKYSVSDHIDKFDVDKTEYSKFLSINLHINEEEEEGDIDDST